MTTKNIFIGLTLLAVFWAGGQALADKRELDVFLGARGEYNDNIFFTADDTISDFITTLSGGLKFLNQTERTDLFLSGIVERLLYSDEKDLDNWDQYYKGRFGYKFTERFRAPGSMPPIHKTPGRTGTWPASGSDSEHGSRADSKIRRERWTMP